MKLAWSLKVAWSLSAREAIAAEFSEITPPHLLLGLLKFAELDSQPMQILVEQNQDALASAISDQKRLCKRLAGDGISVPSASRPLRYALRQKLGKGGSPQQEEIMHRSRASRLLFDLAAKLAFDRGGDELDVVHLYEALMQAMDPVLHQTVSRQREESVSRKEDRGPIFLGFCREIHPAAAFDGKDAAVKVIARALLGGTKPSLLLIEAGGSPPLEAISKALTRAGDKRANDEPQALVFYQLDAGLINRETAKWRALVDVRDWSQAVEEFRSAGAAGLYVEMDGGRSIEGRDWRALARDLFPKLKESGHALIFSVKEADWSALTPGDLEALDSFRTIWLHSLRLPDSI